MCVCVLCVCVCVCCVCVLCVVCQVKKVELKECLMHDQQDKKRAYENYRQTAELSTGGGRKYIHT